MTTMTTTTIPVKDASLFGWRPSTFKDEAVNVDEFGLLQYAPRYTPLESCSSLIHSQPDILSSQPSSISSSQDSSYLTTDRRNQRNRARDPSWVPRPRNAFIIFRCEYSREHSNASFRSDDSVDGSDDRGSKKITEKTLSKRAADAWKQLPADKKARFKSLAEHERDEHARQNPNYRFRPMRRGSSVRRRRQSDETEGDVASTGRASIAPEKPHDTGIESVARNGHGPQQLSIKTSFAPSVCQPPSPTPSESPTSCSVPTPRELMSRSLDTVATWTPDEEAICGTSNSTEALPQMWQYQSLYQDMPCDIGSPFAVQSAPIAHAMTPSLFHQFTSSFSYGGEESEGSSPGRIDVNDQVIANNDSKRVSALFSQSLVDETFTDSTSPILSPLDAVASSLDGWNGEILAPSHPEPVDPIYWPQIPTPHPGSVKAFYGTADVFVPTHSPVANSPTTLDSYNEPPFPSFTHPSYDMSTPVPVTNQAENTGHEYSELERAQALEAYATGLNDLPPTFDCASPLSYFMPLGFNQVESVQTGNINLNGTF